MKLNDVNGSVIWRLPGSRDIYTLEGTNGEDKFLIAPFDNTDHILRLQGTITPVKDVRGLLTKWRPGTCSDLSSTSKDAYMHWVNLAKEKMITGQLRKAVIARRQWTNGPVNIPGMFSRLLHKHQDAFVYAFMLDNHRVMMGASPETLLRKEGGKLYTEALGGTRTKGRYTEKELKEHSHIADYIQSVLISRDYVYSKQDMDVRQAGEVQHLLTGFEAKSKGMDNDLDLAVGLHPTPAVCGLPVDMARDFISQTETFDRGFYTGFLGPLPSSGDLSFFVNLRCGDIYSNGLATYAGAGLNVMSDAEDEWEETTGKMRTIMSAYQAD